MNPTFQSIQSIRTSIFFIVCAIASLPNSALAQKKGPIAQFDHKHHDFGKLEESVNYATHRFTFKNEGDRPVRITNVESSCGCTTPSWSPDSIAPGQTGFVDAKYETINRIGKFNKTITVYTNSPNSPMVFLDISGEVLKPKETTSTPMPNGGSLELDRQSILFEPLYDNGIDSKEFKITNNTSYTTNFIPLNYDYIPSYCKVLNYPTSLEPGEFAKITVQLDGVTAPGYGYGGFEIPILSDNVSMPTTGVIVSYSRKQYFPKLTEKQLKKAPKLTIPNPMYNFGPQNSGGYVKCTFDFKNTGKKDLIIRQITPDCPCITVKSPKTTLKPGETVTLNILFDTVTKYGQKTMGIRIVSNDPVEPERYIWVKAQFPEKYQYKCPTCP